MKQVINTIIGKGYQLIRLPDGEVHVKLDELDRKEEVDIVCRIRNAEELFILMQISDILNRQGVIVNKMTITYLMGSRYDRVISWQDSYSLEIVSKVIKSFHPLSICTVDQHSIVTEHLLNSYSTLSQFEVVNSMIYDQGMTICFPDKGAYNRYNYAYGNIKVGELTEDTEAVILCNKVRDAQTGALTGFEIDKIEGEYKEGAPICVVDDLCDGGGTFIGVINELRKLNPGKIVLVVTHAIQEEGIKRVAKEYDEVYITDSYKDWSSYDLPSNVRVTKLDCLSEDQSECPYQG